MNIHYHQIINTKLNFLVDIFFMTDSTRFYLKFLQLKKSKILPPKIINKLTLLSQSITQQKHEISEYPQLSILSEQQIQSFNQIPQSVKKSLFCQIVQSLIQETKSKVYVQKQVAYLRKKFEDGIWIKCLFSLDDTKISLLNQKNQQIIKEMSIKKISDVQVKLLHKGKYQVFFNYKTNPIWLGFDKENMPTKIVNFLKRINQSNNKKPFTKSSVNKVSQLSISQCYSQLQIQQQKKKFKQRILSQEETLKQFAINFVNQQKSQYKLIQAIEKGRLLKNITNQKIKYKISLLLQDVTIKNIVQNYMKMKQWNTFVQTFDILSKVSENSYNVLIIFKKRSYFNYFQSPKGAIMNISGSTHENRSYLIFRSIQIGEHEYEYSKRFQKFQFTQVVQILTKQNTSFYLFNIIFQLNQVKQSSSDQYWICQFLKYHISNLPSFLLSKSMQPQQSYIFQRIQDKNTQFYSIFNNSFIQQSQQTIVQLQEPGEYSQRSQIFQERIDKVQVQEENYDMKRKKTIHQQVILHQNKAYQIQNYIMKNEGLIINEHIIELLKNNQHQKYYLKHHFDQEPHIDLKQLQYNSQVQFFFQNGRFMKDSKNQIIFCDKQAIQKQKDIIVYIIKKAGSAILSGESIMNMSLPVQIFEPRSTTQRMAMALSSFPKYLQKAGNMIDPLDQLKVIMQFLVSIGTLMVNVEKAFNPILGQTLEVRIGGIPLYVEQIFHHPPITAIYAKTQTFQFSGSFNSYLSLGLNHAVGKTLHLLKIKFFKSQSQFQLKLFDIQASGLIYGDRTVKPTQKCFAYEINKNLYGQVALGKHKKQPYIVNKSPTENDLQGGFYLVNNSFKKRFLSTKMKVKFQGIKSSDIVQTYGNIKGTWLGQMFINQQKVRDLNDPMPNKLQFLQYVLPSDSNLREDIIYRKLLKISQSNAQKQKLQNIQRRDKKLREGKIKY